MKNRTRTILGWVFAAPVIAFSLFAGVMKFVPIVPGTPAEEMSNRLGMTGMMYQFGVLELLVLIIFLIPRTSTVGFVLMIGYLGGALATNLTHGFTHLEALPMYISLGLLTLSAWFRNPELTARLLKRPYPTK